MPVVNIKSPYNRNLRLKCRKYKQFTSKYHYRVVIYARRGFIRLATGLCTLFPANQLTSSLLL